ncbi:UNVERIFIED_CONTAM: hypothetical protein GTU68_052996 [Idotea baltica]|nr:hypothetical protein [Idotea baltica]
MQAIALITIVVLDYDDAIDFYVRKLGFTLIEDTVMSPTKRWVQVSPHGPARGTSLLLAQATEQTQKAAVGNQTGGRVGFFLHTDDLAADYERLLNHQVTIIRPPEKHDYGHVLVFADLYGNKWDLIQPN